MEKKTSSDASPDLLEERPRKASGEFVCVGATEAAETGLVKGVVLTSVEGVKGIKQGKTYRVEFTEIHPVLHEHVEGGST